jgi:carbon-monoxide dehydrogenase medium subunit
VERSAEAATAVPLLAAGLPRVGHRELRNRGTVGGSLAHADPAAELPAVAVALGATVLLRGADGERAVPATEFFTGPLSTARESTELLIEVRFPVARRADGHGFAEVARRHGDFALCGAAARVRDGQASLGLFGVGPTPVGVELADVTADRVAEHADSVADGLTPTGDMHGSAGYRRRLAATLVRRAVAAALEDAA